MKASFMTASQTYEGVCPDDVPAICEFEIDGMKHEATYYGSIDSLIPPLPVYIVKETSQVI